MARVTTKDRKDAQTYRDVARNYENGRYLRAGGPGTEGVCDVLGLEPSPFSIPDALDRNDLRLEFRRAFVENPLDPNEYLYFIMSDVIDDPYERTDVRILALCLLAAIVDSGDRKRVR